jgi:lambda repressor-like predicted transcriptional regulator
MPRPMIDDAQIMRIYRLREAGYSLSQISVDVNVAFNTVRSHLSGEYRYSESLISRLKNILPSVVVKVPDGFLTLSEAANLIPTRPSSRTVSRLCYLNHLKAEMHGRRRFTTEKWVMQYIDTAWPDRERGQLVHIPAVPYLLDKRPGKEFKKMIRPSRQYGMRVVPIHQVKEIAMMTDNQIRSQAAQVIEMVAGKGSDTIIIRRSDFTKKHAFQPETERY